MIKKIIILNLFLIFSITTSSFSREVKLYLDDSYTKFIKVEKQDCSIHKNKDNSVKFGLKFGNILFSFGPEVTFGKKTGIDWNKSVQAFISRYQALCSRFNSGSITKEEYDVETKKLEEIEGRMAKLEMEARDAITKDAASMFSRLDKELNMMDQRSKEEENNRSKRIKSELKEIREELQGEQASHFSNSRP